MKEKIFAKLKAAILLNGKTDISDETLNTFAGIIGEKITEETQIDEAIKPQVLLLKAMQGNINAVAATSVKAEKEAKAALEKQIEELKKLIPAKKDDKPETLTLEDVRKLIEETTKADREKIALFEAQTKQTVRQTEIASKLKELGLTEADMKFVTVPEDKDVTSFLTDYRQDLISRGLKPLENEGTKQADLKSAEETAKGWLDNIEVKTKS
jgi:poly-D-alanine transfer protein DltD